MRRAQSLLFPLISIFLLLIFSTLSYGQAWSGILPPARATDWSQAGIPGGIPSGSWSQCGSTIASGASTATIQTAINNCGNNQFVLLGAGTFTLTTSLVTNRSNVELRGSGPRQTTINLSGHDIFFGNGSGGQGSTPGGLNSTTLSTLANGSTTLTVGSTTGLSSGQVVAIMENNEAWVQPTGNENNENATWCRSPLAFFGCSTMSAFQFVRISSVPDSTHIVIDAPGLTQTYSSGLSPIVVSWSTTGVYWNDGVRDMKINIGNNAGDGVSFVFCHECWVKNVAITGFSNSSLGAVYFFFSYRGEVRDSYISAQNSGGGPTQYGIVVDRGQGTKIENNILFGVTTPINIFTSNSVVVGYNYTFRSPVDNVFPQMITHRAHSYKLLHEGNVSARLEYDFVHGSSSHNTSFRNYFSGTEPNATNYRNPWEADAHNRYMNAVANVLGDSSYHTAYECTLAHDTGGSDTMIYDLGWFNGCEFGGSSGYDTVVESSLVRWGNWDAVSYNTSGGSHQGTHYCTGAGSGTSGTDAYNTNCLASETASSDPTFPGLSSPSSTLPASFYTGASTHASCGTGLSFWKNPSSGYCPPYPPIGPDATCTANCISNAGNHATMIPAQLCYQNTAKDGNGFLTAFDASACYAADPTSVGSGSPPAPPAPPAPPTNLTGVVN